VLKPRYSNYKPFRGKPLKRPRLPRKWEFPWGHAQGSSQENGSRDGSPLSGTIDESTQDVLERVPRKKLCSKTWLRSTRILRIDGLLKRKQLNPGVARLLVCGFQVTEGLKQERVKRSFVDEVRHLVRNTHRFYNEIAKGNYIPWGLNSFGKSLELSAQQKFARSPNLAKEIRISPDIYFRKILCRRFPTNLGFFLRLNEAQLGKLLAAA